MPGKQARTVVKIVSIVIAIISIIDLFWLRVVQHTRVPLLDKVAVVYGLVFCLFLFFDSVGRKIAQLRMASDEEKARPRPRPVPVEQHSGPDGQPAPGTPNRLRQAMAHAPAMTEGQIHLERVRSSQAELLQKMVDEAVAETMALEEQRPELDATGHVADMPVHEWLDNPLYFAFWIVYHDITIGCCAFQSVHPAYELLVYYVEPVYRRRHGGQVGMEKLVEFARLLDTHAAIVTDVSSANMRAQQFFRACDFHFPRDYEIGSGRYLMQRRIHGVHT